jgi:hypothetical protein
MASNDPGLAPMGALAEDAKRGSVDATGEEDDRLIAPDQFEERFESTRTEIWAYYL